ncbi:MAG TPA: nuclear transport factor 2 family protein [Myxococcota bacterium]|nr:nuclear transport factor 2 family protein [Myxococcota bacterium]
MGRISQFVNYALKFEQAYALRDFSICAPCFTEDAVYAISGPPPFGGEHKGRAAVLAYFDGVTQGFDQRFASREVLALDGPEERRDHVFMHWAAIYRLPGAPELRIEGDTKAFFSGDAICRLEDEIPAEFAQRTAAYLAAHGAKLAPAPAAR